MSSLDTVKQFAAEWPENDVATVRSWPTMTPIALSRVDLQVVIADVERQAERIKALEAELAQLREGRDALEASDECGVDGIPPCHAKPNATEADWCRMCLVARYRHSQRLCRIAEELGIRFAPWHPTDPERHDNVAATALKAELALESALVATLQDSLSAAQVAHHETAQLHDDALRQVVLHASAATKLAQERDRLASDNDALIERLAALLVKWMASEGGAIEGRKQLTELRRMATRKVEALEAELDDERVRSLALAATPGEPE